MSLGQKKRYKQIREGERGAQREEELLVEGIIFILQREQQQSTNKGDQERECEKLL